MTQAAQDDFMRQLRRQHPRLFLSTMRHTEDSDFLQVARATAVDAWTCQSREQNPVSSDEGRVSSGAGTGTVRLGRER